MPSPKIIIFDQLEEIFDLLPKRWREEQEGFFKEIANSLNKNPFVRVVFVIREDYLSQLDSFAGILPEKLRPRFRLELINADQAAKAIMEPLTKIARTTNEEKLQNEAKEMIDHLIKGVCGTNAASSCMSDMVEQTDIKKI